MIVSLRKIINGNINVKFYGSNDIVTLSVRNILHDDFSSLTPICVPMEEHDLIMDENNQR